MKYLLIIWIGGALFFILKLIWKPLFASTVNHELAETEGMNPDKINAIFNINSSYNQQYLLKLWGYY